MRLRKKYRFCLDQREAEQGAVHARKAGWTEVAVEQRRRGGWYVMGLPPLIKRTWKGR